MTRAFMLRYTCETCGRIWVGDGKKTIQDYCNHVDVCEQGKKVIHQELVRSNYGVNITECIEVKGPSTQDSHEFYVST
ncbi:hypothetical protein LCGC14_1764360 [marine sediment metagenome]|uniref:Uncharacterized protein n=1 Tax=marine sediment metagenome TaxID=412755 RepID=A0A0F9HML0_9ZZZZ